MCWRKAVFFLGMLLCWPLAAEDLIMLMSDSTAVDYWGMKNSYNPDPGAGWAPMSGWGEHAKDARRGTVKFINCSAGGYSSKMYAERRLGSYVKHFRKDGWLLLSFGCNDARPGGGNGYDRTTKPESTYPEYMGKIVDAAEKAGMKVVVISPMPFFQMDGGRFDCKLLRPYAEASRKFAADRGLHFIDLYQLLTARFRGMKEADIRSHYMFLKPGDSPNWPRGRHDPLHLTGKGSKLVWSLVRGEIDRKIPELSRLFVGR